MLSRIQYPPAKPACLTVADRSLKVVFRIEHRRDNCYIVSMLKTLARLGAAGIALEGVWIATGSIGPLREHTVPFLALMGLAFALCIWVFFRVPIHARQATWLVLGFALLFRLTALWTPPYQSEDVYRYLWDARTSSLGISPYAYPPNAPELERYRDDQIYPMINSKPYITAYPPVSQILFRMSYALAGSSVFAMKAVFSLFELGALLLAWRLLVLWKQNLQPLLLMAWHPFFVFEFSGSGHSDSAMMFFALLSIYLLSRNRNAWALISYAGAVFAKLHPALWFPLFLRRAGWKSALAGLVTGLGFILLYFDPASWLRYLDSLKLYFRLFEFNASVHYLIRFIGQAGYHDSWDKLIGPYLGALLLLIAVVIVWRFPIRGARDVMHAAFWLMTADLCLATTVHPWYLSWAAFALPFFPYAFMTYWTGACFLSYLAYAYHPVHEPAWVLLAEYLPVYGLMAWEIVRRRPMMPDWLEQSLQRNRSLPHDGA